MLPHNCRDPVLFVGRLPCGGVCVAMSCGGGFLTLDGTYDSFWDSVKLMTGNYFFQLFPVPRVRWVYLHAEFLVQQQ